MVEGNNDSQAEQSAPLSSEKNALPSSPARPNAASTENPHDERLKKANGGTGIYPTLLIVCLMFITTLGDFIGFQKTVAKGSFSSSFTDVNPMQYISTSTSQLYNQTSGFWLSVPTPSPQEPPKNHSVAMCVIQKQTVEYFEEWMLYHKALGFDKFYVYDNQEDNEFERWLQTQSQEIKDMVGNYTVWPGAKQQVKVYLDCWNRIRNAKSHEWVGFFDVDEYVVIKDLDKYPTIMDFLDSLPEHQYGLTLNWVMFYFNGHMKKEDKPVTMRFHNYSSIPGTVKSFVRAQVKPKMKNPHYINYKLNKNTYAYMSMDSRGNVVQKYENIKKEVRDIALYHYVTKSLEEYKERCARGDVLRNEKDWATMLFCRPDEEILAHFNYSEMNVFDDRPWKFLQERVPEYTQRYTTNSTR